MKSRVFLFLLAMICLAATFNGSAQTNTSLDKQKAFGHLKDNIKKYGLVEDVILNDTACKLTVKYSNRDIEVTISKMSDKHFTWDKENKQLILTLKSEPGLTAFREKRTDSADSYSYTKELYLRFDLKKTSGNPEFTTEMENDFKSLIKLCH